MSNKSSKKPSLSSLLEKSRKIKSISEAVPEVIVKDEGQVPLKPIHGKAVVYYVEFEDGVSMLARGEHADIVYRFTREAQEITSNDGTLYYEGPALKEYSKLEAIRLMVGN